MSYFYSYEILLTYPLRRTAVHINSLFNKTTTTIFVSCSTCSHSLCLFYVTYSFISYADPTTSIWLQVLKSKLRVSKIINDVGCITLQSNKNHLHYNIALNSAKYLMTQCCRKVTNDTMYNRITLIITNWLSRQLLLLTIDNHLLSTARLIQCT